MYPVEINYLREPCNDYVQMAVQTVCFIHKSNLISSNGNDILVFLTGVEEISHFVRLMNEVQQDKIINRDIFAVPLFAGLGIKKQMEAFMPTPFGKSEPGHLFSEKILLA